MMLYGDYYPLTPFHRSQEKWVVRQFDQPENGKGLIQGFRLPACSQDEFLIFPQGLEPEATYILENPESGETVEMAGSDLVQDGFKLVLAPRSAAIWFYRKK